MPKAMDPKTRTYDKHWLPWLKRELLERGVPTETLLMPNPWNPEYERFKKEVEKCDVNEDTVLIGHSCSCAFLVRWLGETQRSIHKLILVAPWKTPDNAGRYQKTFYDFVIDPTIASRTRRIVMFTADDEEEDGKKGLQMYHDALGGEVIELTGHGHYTLGDMGTEMFPELLAEVLKP